jgi:exopolysaccharide/PEP-CTERM locus tyrosine autokinase
MSVVERALEKLRRGAPEREAVPEVRPQGEPIGELVDTELLGVHAPKLLVDREKLRAAGYLPEAEQDRQFADEYRQIKRPLLATSFGSPKEGMPPSSPSPRLVMMASALPGDGKTFTCINLALSLAREKDCNVLLVDGDVAKPHVSGIFGVQDSPGLLDALSDESVDLASLILPTDVPGFYLLPSGKPRDGATELLSSERMKEQCRLLIEKNPRLIALFDSSPLLVSSESRAVAATVGQILLVVRGGKTPKDAFLDAVEALDVNIPLGLVLNQGRRSPSEGLYGYGTYDDYKGRHKKS